MQLLNILFAALACTTTVSAVKLKCSEAQQPYCCNNIAKLNIIGTATGVHCTAEPRGAKSHCKTKQDKVCCRGDHSPANVGELVNLCELPLGLAKKLKKAGIPGIPGNGGAIA